MQWDAITADDRDAAMIRTLDEEADIGELITSIIKNMYIHVEPLIVIKDGEKFRVLEGNRRLAAMRLLMDPELAKECGIKIPGDGVAKKILNSFKFVSVYEVKDVADAHALIGFKHIKGPYKWGSFAKAKYVTQQYKDTKQPIEEIAATIGDENDTVRKMIGGMLVLEQAQSMGLFDVADRAKVGPIGFSHLYTALEKPDYRTFLGLKRNWNAKPSKKPISDDKRDELKEVLLYLYGSKSDGTPSLIKSQNPDLTNLGKTIASSEGLADLRAGLTLEIAYNNVRDDDEVFNEAIRKALAQVNYAMSCATRYDGKDGAAVAVAEKIQKGANILLATVQKIHSDQK